MHSVFLDQGSMGGDDLDYSILDQLVPGYITYAKTEANEVLERIQGAEIVMTNKVVLDRDILSSVPTLKLICVTATGTNNVDLVCARENNIAVSHARAYATPSVVEHVFALLTNLIRHLNDYQRASIDGRWAQSPYFSYMNKSISELAGKTMGIIGYGELGRAVAQVAKAFGMRVLIAQRPGSDTLELGRLPMDEFLKQVDVLSLHCPLEDNTRNLVDRHAFELMPNHAILINTARGGIVNEVDLLDALKSGAIAAAGIDVLEEEPPRQGNVLLGESLENLIVTPHVAWASRESRQRLLAEIVDNIKAYKAGKRRNRVD